MPCGSDVSLKLEQCVTLTASVNIDMSREVCGARALRSLTFDSTVSVVIIHTPEIIRVWVDLGRRAGSQPDCIYKVTV